MNTLNFQRIAEILESVLPDKWTKVVFRAEYRPGGYTMKYYVKETVNGVYIDCFKLPDISSNEITLAYLKLDEELYKTRKDVPVEDRWSVFTMTIDAAGKFKSDYSYEKIDDDYNSYIEKWTQKYLK